MYLKIVELISITLGLFAVLYILLKAKLKEDLRSEFVTKLVYDETINHIKKTLDELKESLKDIQTTIHKS